MSNYKKYMRRFVLRRWGLFIILFIGLVLILDWNIRPLVKSIAANKAQVATTKAINESVEQELSELGLNYCDFIKLERASDGKILAITSDATKINLLKASISSNIQQRLSNTEPRQIFIPIGTLTGLEILSGRGPMIKMKISLPGSVFTEFESNFTNAGINQTKHQIYLNVHTTIHALIPGYPTTTTVDTNIIIAETIIVGDIPKVFANLNSANPNSFLSLYQNDDKEPIN